jgi:uncharacterized FlgJ-related protein
MDKQMIKLQIEMPRPMYVMYIRIGFSKVWGAIRIEKEVNNLFGQHWQTACWEFS